MRKVLLLTTMLIMALGMFAQDVTTLTFTAKCQNEVFQRLDSVVVTNLDREWTEVLYYPDTLLLMNTVGITNYQSENGKVKLYQNIPNPFHGVTNFNLTLFDKEKVELLIFDVNGRKVAEYHNTLPCGEHQFRAVMNTAQTYLLSAATKHGSTSIKMINLSHNSESCLIEHIGSLPLSETPVKKETPNQFAKGDKMQYVGYATQKDGAKSVEIKQNQQGSENITFVFPNEKMDPEVSVTSLEATDIDTNSAILYGSYSVKYTEVKEIGFSYKLATDDNFTMVSCQDTTTPFSLKITDLESGAEYQYKAYVKTSDNFVIYGNLLNFTTLKIEKAEVVTETATEITTTTAILNGSYILNDESLTKIGFEIKEDSASIYRVYEVNEITSPYQYICQDLQPATTYQYRAFGTTQTGEQRYGAVLTFTTDTVIFKVQTISVNNIGKATAQVTSKLTTNCPMTNVQFGVRLYCQEPKFETLYFSDEILDGIFVTQLVGLSKGVHYYVQAYAKDANTEIFGETLEFTTLSLFSCGDSLTDYEKTNYATVYIGSQCWMAEDMRCKTYSDGTPISSGYYLYTENKTMGDLAYYDFAAATRSETNDDINKGVQGICPDGWHIPSYADYNALCQSIDSLFSGPTTRLQSNKAPEYKSEAHLGIKLAYPNYWVIPATGPIANTPSSYITSTQDFNASGFNGIARGYIKNSTVSCPGSAHYWTSVGTPKNRCDVFKITATSTGITYQSYEKSGIELYGVRCVADSSYTLPNVKTLSPDIDSYDQLGVKLQGKVISVGNGNLTEIGFYFGTQANPIYYGQKIVVSDAYNFIHEIPELTPNTTYYYAAFMTTDQETIYGDIVSFTTREKGQAPTLESGQANAYASSAKVNATLLSTGGETMLELGFCYGENINPTIENDQVIKMLVISTGEFSALIPDLKSQTTYHVRPYAINKIATVYGDDISFTTTAITRPEVMTVSLFDSTQSSVIAKGKLLHHGGDTDIEVGFVYSDDNDEPTLSNSHVSANLQDDSLFTAFIQNLQRATTYYVRAYAKNQIDTTYGEVIKFNTLSSFTCGDVLIDIDSNQYKTVKIGKQCWMQENLKVHRKPNGESITSGYWDYNDTKYGLGENTYYLWNVATQLSKSNIDENAKIQGICPDGWHIPAYGDFKELCLYIDPEIEYVSVPTDATKDQTVTSNNKLCIKLCQAHPNWSLASGTPEEGTPAWGTAHNDTDFNASKFSALPFGYKDNNPSGSFCIGPGNQAGFLTSNNPYSDASFGRTFGVKPAQTGIRHEKTNGHGWSVRCIMDPNPSLPNVSTLAADLKTYDNIGALLKGQIISIGSGQIKESGFYFGTNANPISQGQKLISSNPNTLQYELPKLSSATTYYYVAYATNAMGTSYGAVMSFTTRTLGTAPIVESKGATSFATYANVTANIKSNGGEKISEIGFCYGTTINPTIEDNSFQTVTVLQVGEFSLMISDLTPNTHYYVRPYATNLMGTSYGDNIEFTTAQITLPAVKSISLSDTSSVSITATGQLINNGGDDNVEFGFVYSDSIAEPTLAHQSISTTDLYKDSTFLAIISDLKPATTYYVRAYAQNSIGSVYGETMSFKTLFACGGAITDVDENTYNTVLIGNYCWMKENLRTTKFSDGTPIASGSESSSEKALRYEPNGDNDNVKEYGYLYNWNAATANSSADLTQGICPQGWHLPTDSNWIELMACVEANSKNIFNSTPEYIAKSLASKDKWSTSEFAYAIGNDLSLNNNTEFSALPAGMFTDNEFSGFGSWARFISSTSYNTTEVIAFSLTSDSATVQLIPLNKTNGFSVRCICDEIYLKETLPSAVTTQTTNVTATAVSLGGNVYDDGESLVTAKGICWSTTPHPTIDNNHTSDGSGLGTFATTLNDLQPATIYYARAYATNYLGVSYGNEVIFMTTNNNDGTECASAATVSDYDGNAYETVQIGGQCWMREHLRTTHYSDGTPIELSTGAMSVETPYRYYPRGKADNVAAQGYLYNWPAVMHQSESSTEVPSEVQGICPSGWHVPSNGEWQLLTDYLSSQSKYYSNKKPRAIAKALASQDNSWSTSSKSYGVGNGLSSNNLSGFNAKSAGGFYGGASGGGLMVSMWSSTEENDHSAFFRSMRYYYAYVTTDRHSKANGFSVRCVKD